MRSCLGCANGDRLLMELESTVSAADLSRCNVPESFDVDFYRGRLSLGSPDYHQDPSVRTGDLLALTREYVPPGSGYTAVVGRYRCVRRLEVDGSQEAVEERNLVGVRASLMVKGGLAGHVTAGRVGVAGFERDVVGMLEEVLRLLRDRVRSIERSRGLGITEAGRVEVVLTREASPALFHELSKLLSADRGRGALGKRLFASDSIRVCDSPGDLRRPSARFFDDEGVVTRRRWLVEGGVVVDLHHGIKTAYEMGSHPGSVHDPLGELRPFHSSLLVEGGAWDNDELIEETKRGFLVEGVVASSLEDYYVRMVPQVAFKLERGEVREPVRIRALRIPLVRPIRLLAMGRGGYTKYSRGPGGSIVTETSPPIKVEAYVEF